MLIKVRYFGLLKNKTGMTEETVSLLNGPTLQNLLEFLNDKYGQVFYIGEKIKLGALFGIKINDTPTSQLKTKLNKGDVVDIIPLIAGG
jgi:MoaD family protein